MKTNPRGFWLLAIALAVAVPASAIEEARKATAEVAASHIDADAPWITHPAAYGADFRQEPIALQFRRSFDLARKPAHLRVRVSADQRFILYVNGHRVATGPARGDLQHYRYETVDIAPQLAAGRNIVAAQVWSDGELAPAAQVSTGHTGFMLKAVNAADQIVDSTAGWEARVDSSRTISSGRRQLNQEVGPTYYVAGPPEQHDAARQLRGWNTGADGGDWKAAVAAVSTGEERRTLVPDTLPQMRYDAPTTGKIVRVVGSSPATIGPVTVQPGQQAAVLYDFGRVMAGYPILVTNGGAGREITLTYSEALYDPNAKGPGGAAVRFADRAKVADGRALGLTDTLVTAGGKQARFEPLWWRVGRYVEIRVAAGQAPLTLDRLEMRETGYPFEQRGRFVSSDNELNQIWQTGWQTALLNAHETYMDSAYWEQLQYIGDTRLQMLISYAVAGDPRLAVQALDAFDQSRVVEGIPQSAYPMRGKNPIPPFALLWINALHDYWMQEPDTAVLRRTLPGARSVLDWYAPYLRENGILAMTPGWLFVDWQPTLSEQNKNNEQRPDSCIITLFYYGALRDAAELETAIGDPARSAANHAQAATVRDRVMDKCWVADRQLFADTPAKTGFSQHANVLAVLYDLIPKEKQKDVLQRITTAEGIDAPTTIIPVTYYFAHYLAEAFNHAGMTDRYIAMLRPWREMVRRNFTTFPENPDPSRSDSHAWSAHPTVGLLTYVAGIQPARPGFGEVRVEPHLGTLGSVDAAMAHPLGLIETRYIRSGKGLSAMITLPGGLSGDFIWKSQSFPLHSGKNQLELK